MSDSRMGSVRTNGFAGTRNRAMRLRSRTTSPLKRATTTTTTTTTLAAATMTEPMSPAARATTVARTTWTTTGPCGRALRPCRSWRSRRIRRHCTLHVAQAPSSCSCRRTRRAMSRRAQGAQRLQESTGLGGQRCLPQHGPPWAIRALCGPRQPVHLVARPPRVHGPLARRSEAAAGDRAQRPRWPRSVSSPNQKRSCDAAGSVSRACSDGRVWTAATLARLR
mmetsp:Transcript_16996/g.48511  ORF Transcript_16996/g.48511 Transcript_16996/m.48511 type:complete len:223 (+) Transcript_16996:135-803(+)